MVYYELHLPFLQKLEEKLLLQINDIEKIAAWFITGGGK